MCKNHASFLNVLKLFLGIMLWQLVALIDFFMTKKCIICGRFVLTLCASSSRIYSILFIAASNAFCLHIHIFNQLFPP